MFNDNVKKMSFFLLLIVYESIAFCSIQATSEKFTGVYWGAFDPPTEAHAAIIQSAIHDIPLEKLIVVVNNQPYKNYMYSLEMRLQMMQVILQQHDLKQLELCWQDESHLVDCKALKKMVQGPLCAIAGYDSYKKWVLYSTVEDRSCYDAIAVVPRGDVPPILFDKMAFLLPIDPKYKDVSSTKVKASLPHKMIDQTCN